MVSATHSSLSVGRVSIASQGQGFGKILDAAKDKPQSIQVHRHLYRVSSCSVFSHGVPRMDKWVHVLSLPSPQANLRCFLLLFARLKLLKLCAACRSVGLILGSGIGGLLAQLAVNYPSLFDSTGVFGR